MNKSTVILALAAFVLVICGQFVAHVWPNGADAPATPIAARDLELQNQLPSVPSPWMPTESWGIKEYARIRESEDHEYRAAQAAKRPQHNVSPSLDNSSRRDALISALGVPQQQDSFVAKEALSGSSENMKGQAAVAKATVEGTSTLAGKVVDAFADVAKALIGIPSKPETSSDDEKDKKKKKEKNDSGGTKKSPSSTQVPGTIGV